MAGKEELAASFDGAVSEYERGRPSYLDEMVEWVLGHIDGYPGRRLDVVDVGAGTGKLTESFAARPLTVSAVEPLPGMREILAAKLPDVAVYEGRGEVIPLPDASADLVTFAQAWHWVDPEATSAEVARVLRPSGMLALIWNIRDESVDWVARLTEVMGLSEAERYDSVTPTVGPPLHRADFAEFGWERRIRRDELLALVASRSYIITMPDAERAAMFGALDELLDSHPDLRGRDEYVLPYVARATIATR